MPFFLRYGAFNMTILELRLKCVLHIDIFYPNKSIDQLYAYFMLDRHIKKVKFKFTIKTQKHDLSALYESFYWI